MPRRLRRELLALLALAAAVLAAARHLILEPGLALQDPAALRQLLGLAQLQRLLTGQQGWSEAWLGWPVGPGFVQADWQLGPALLAWPMGALGIGFHVQYSALAVAGMLLTAERPVVEASMDVGAVGRGACPGLWPGTLEARTGSG